ncbi:glycosyltransferase family 4 protein [Pseudocnuella soli]|uniref:glycosyltransferase family 4 protein n=1 Tax=Pseudocnuella soli TaxID=2502779 RepID=UPI00104FD476|nr:glycosyltransferase family 4 protein [Pseudocnuella soli]
MNILFYSRGFAPIGGIETLYKNLAVFLQSKGHNCSLLYWGAPNPLLRSIEAADVQIVRSFWQWGCRWNVPDWVMLPQGMREVKKADIVVFGNAIPSKMLASLRKSAGPHSKFVFITPYRPTPPQQAADRAEALQMLQLFDHVMVQAAAFKGDLREIGFSGAVSVLPYLTQEPAAVAPFPKNDVIQLGFLGRLVEDKNLPLLLQSFKVYRSLLQQQKTHLQLFGTGHLQAEMETLADSLGLKEYVTFHGGINNEKVMDAVASCHLFAFSSNIEGQCLAALEILSCGRPIVATEAGAFPEILSDTRLGQLVPQANPEKFGAALYDVTQRILQKDITEQSVRESYNLRFSASKIALQYEALFKQICGASKEAGVKKNSVVSNR